MQVQGLEGWRVTRLDLERKVVGLESYVSMGVTKKKEMTCFLFL